MNLKLSVKSTTQTIFRKTNQLLNIIYSFINNSYFSIIYVIFPTHLLHSHIKKKKNIREPVVILFNFLYIFFFRTQSYSPQHSIFFCYFILRVYLGKTPKCIFRLMVYKCQYISELNF